MTAEIHISGPLFEGGEAIVKDMVAVVVSELARRAVVEIQPRMVPGHGYRTGAAQSDLQSAGLSWNEAHVFTTLDYWPYVEDRYQFLAEEAADLQGIDMDEFAAQIADKLNGG